MLKLLVPCSDFLFARVSTPSRSQRDEEAADMISRKIKPLDGLRRVSGG
jgi:hypothetical protein